MRDFFSKRVPFVFLLTASMLCFAPWGQPARAANGRGYQGGGSCNADIQKFCGNLIPGSAKILKCLDDNLSSLSSGCKARVERHILNVESRLRNCQNDIREFCPDVKPGSGAIVRCLLKNENNISMKCASELSIR
ncbi:MAG: cysteine rich repeat-containing protein [Nitrospiraceae bacterium]|nr:cysteine rich repeat-containing protein [Nitrospiraceae bacterium]